MLLNIYNNLENFLNKHKCILLWFFVFILFLKKSSMKIQ